MGFLGGYFWVYLGGFFWVGFFNANPGLHRSTVITNYALQSFAFMHAALFSVRGLCLFWVGSHSGDLKEGSHYISRDVRYPLSIVSSVSDPGCFSRICIFPSRILVKKYSGSRDEINT